MTDREVYLAAARAYCRAKFSYHRALYSAPDGAERHVEADAESTANEEPFRAAIEAAENQVRAQVAAERAEFLRQAADGRSEYLRDVPPGHMREILEIEIATIQQAARVVEGDLVPLYHWLPAQLWTDEMNAQLDALDAPSGTVGNPQRDQDRSEPA